MRIALLETSSSRGAVALAEDNQLLQSSLLPSDRKHARDLIPSLRDLLDCAGWRARDVELVVVDVGPGSYTGLRVGVMAAKTLSFTVGCPIVGVDAMRILACQAPSTATDIWTIVDAQQAHLYVARFVRKPDVENIHPTRRISIDAWIQALQPGSYVIGPGLATLRGGLPDAAIAAPEAEWDPRIDNLHTVGWKDFLSGIRHDPFTIVPLYLRGSSAEEKWLARSQPAEH